MKKVLLFALSVLLLFSLVSCGTNSTCPQCGHPTEAKDSFCSNCGAVISNNVANNDEKYDDGRLEYTLVESGNNETYKITGVIDKTITEISIPKTYKNRAVTAIESNAFTGCTSLKTIVVPDSITSISEGAFSGCSALQNITIPFVGASADLTNSDYQFPFGYIFGTSNYEGSEKTEQAVRFAHVNIFYSATYYIPSSLKSVTIASEKTTWVGGFDDCIGLESIKIMQGITHIGMYAFKGCSNLKNIILPDTVTYIDMQAFHDCTNLTSIVIPNSVTTIRSEAFLGCYKLVEVINHSSLDITAGSQNFGGIGFYAIEVHDGDSNIVEENDYHFYVKDDKNYLINYTGTGTNLILPKTINGNHFEINQFAFYNNTAIETATMPESITHIGSHAFYGCSGLRSIEIPEGIAEIDRQAFSECTALEEIYFNAIAMNDPESDIFNNAGKNSKGIQLTIGKSVTRIPNYLFYNYYSSSDSPNITSVEFEEGSTCQNVTYALKECNNIAYNTYENGKYLGSKTNPYMFLMSVVDSACQTFTIHPNTQIIEDNVFAMCKNLSSIAIPDEIKHIRTSAFEGCTNLRGVYITNLTAWCNVSFDNSSSNPLSYAGNLYLNEKLITDLVIPDNVTRIGAYAFFGGTRITNVTIHKNVMDIGTGAFACYSSLVNFFVDNDNSNYMVIDGSLYSKDGKTLIKYASEKASTSIIIPDSVTSIANYAFYQCASITRITISQNTKSIEWAAFEGCNALKEIRYGGTKAEWIKIQNETFLWLPYKICIIICTDGAIKYF